MPYSVLINNILNKKAKEFSFAIDSIRKLESGFIFNKLETKGRHEKRLFRVQLNLFCVVWVSVKDSNQVEGLINLKDIKEIRLLTKTLDDKSIKCFSIFYGKKFKLKELTAFADPSHENSLELWINGIQYLRRELCRAPHHSLVDIMLRREFIELSRMSVAKRAREGSVFLKDMKTFLAKVQYKMSNEQLKENFFRVDKEFVHKIDFDGFTTFYDNLINCDINKFFSEHIRGLQCSDPRRVSLNEFIDFYEREQKVDPSMVNEKQMADLIRDYLLDPLRHYEIDPYFTTTEFVDYLYSKENSVFDSQFNTVYQDMDQPLCHYFIATSHNTYLSGDQFKSESSVECYARCLRNGCRCIELDCWDGPEGKPLIYHGRTLTSRIRFIDVIKTIKDHAFVASDYPLILSIENHCSLRQQQYMAEAFRQVFGDLLLKQQIDANESAMPSPNQLKGKIILKHKKLTKLSDEKPLSSPKIEETNEFDLDISDAIKNGILFIEDQTEKRWKSQYFVLTREKLFYVEPSSEEEEEDEEEDNIYGQRTDSVALYEDNAYEMHFGETWFHGKIKGPKGARFEAEMILRKYLCSNCSDGTFLVRESESHVGAYSLSFIYQNECHHSCITVTQDPSGHKKYSLNEFVTFTSLYELITHYQTHPLRSQKFQQLYLTTPVPQPNSHEDKVWFYKNMSRSQAEDILRRLRNDGAFLVRPSEKSVAHDENLFAISFRAENKIKHCRIRREGRLFVIGSAEFESLTELIEYYEKHPLYRKVKLKFPATEENVRILGEEPDLELQCNYTNPKANAINVKACYDYLAKSDQELSFFAGDIITNVTKQDHGWWKGDLGNKIGHYFPSNFVEEIEEQEIKCFDSKLALDMKHGTIELDDGLSLVPIVQRSDREWVFRLGSLDISAQSEEDMREWVNKIQETLQMNKSVKISLRNSKELKQNLKIAPELNELIVYCSAVPFIGSFTHFTEMSSFHEIKIEKLINPQNFRNILRYNERQLSRVYPKGSRIDSSNYEPNRMWNCGVQMVALNYQTPDKAMQLNDAMYLQNGRSGYVLKPKFMFDDNYNPYEKPTNIDNFEPIVLTVRVIGARHLRRALKGIVSPSIEIEVIGVDYDCRKCLTRVINDNGLNPVWNSETFVFNIMFPELAFVRFLVNHLDTFDDSSFVGHSTLPVVCMRRGYRSVQLKNEYNEELELSTLLIHIDIRKAKDNNIKTSMEMLRQAYQHLNLMIAESEKRGNHEEVKKYRNVLDNVSKQIRDKTDEKRFITLSLNDKNEVKLINELSLLKSNQTRKNSL